MEIRLRKSYMAALAKLGTAEQERIEKFISKLDRDPTTLGLHIEPIDNGFVSIRANQRIRVIAQQQGDVLLLHFIGDHDPAYEWAKKRRLLASLEDGSYRFDPDDELDSFGSVDKTSTSSQETILYGEEIVGKLAGSDLPEYIVRSLETCKNEDELYERLETLPQHFQYAALAAIQDLPYHPDPRVAMPRDESNTSVSTLHNSGASLGVTNGSEVSDQIGPTTQVIAASPPTAISASNTDHPVSGIPATALDEAPVASAEVFEPQDEAGDVAAPKPPSDLASIPSEEPEPFDAPTQDQRNRPVGMDLLTEPPSGSCDESIAQPSLDTQPIETASAEVWVMVIPPKHPDRFYRLKIFDGDMLLGEYERCVDETHVQRKISEILATTSVLKAAYTAHGEFTVRWNGVSRTKDIRNALGQVVGHVPFGKLMPEPLAHVALGAGSTDPTDGASPSPVVYNATRLLFRAAVIEPLLPNEAFRVITPDGAFQMTKSEFYRDFANVVASASYREKGIYHYPTLPRRALPYRL